MLNRFNYILCIGLFLGSYNLIFGQLNRSFWENAIYESTDSSSTYLLNENTFMYNAHPTDISKQLLNRSQEITLPTIDGSYAKYHIKPVQIIDPSVAHLYSIRTFSGYNIDDPSVPIRCDVSAGGFHATVYNHDITMHITPLDHQEPSILVVVGHDQMPKSGVACGVDDALDQIISQTENISSDRNPNTKKTYRLAISAAGEYSQQFGGTPFDKQNVLNAMAAGLNMLAPIYLRDVGVEFTLVSTDALVWEDPATDPFNTSDAFGMLNANNTEINNALGSDGYDIGHLVIWKNLGGLAYVGVTCINNYKAKGYSGIATTVQTLWIDYVGHEIGHQFGARHNFSATECSNSSVGHRFEAGDGATIMCYTNLCGSAVNQSDTVAHYFHYNSVQSMYNHMNNVSCYGVDNTGNSNTPTADAKLDFTVPKNTAFVLVGDGSDPQDTTLTYSWQQYDGNGPPSIGAPDCDSLAQPISKYKSPSSDKIRYIPDLSHVLAGQETNVTWEKLPCVAGTLHYMLMVRDNNTSFGRIDGDSVKVTIADTGPFKITSPNGGENLTVGTPITVQWTVNNTNTHTPNIDILFSGDGGSTFSVLENSVANDGSHTFNVPNYNGTTARFMIRSDIAGGHEAASAFYDVSDGNIIVSGSFPVLFNGFYGFAQNDAIDLTWITELEVNSEKFTIEKLIEGDWKTIGEQKGQGTTDQKNTYHFTDNYPLLGSNVYRLKQWDLNQSFTYSDIVEVLFNNQVPQVYIFPNPVKNLIYIKTDELEEATVSLYHTNGQLIAKRRFVQETTLKTEHLPDGIYFVQYMYNGKSVMKKISKVP